MFFDTRPLSVTLRPPAELNPPMRRGKLHFSLSSFP